MLISHEIPKCLFKDHHRINDYPYLLAHLLSGDYSFDREYSSFYKKCIIEHEISYLDNSCYELGYPVDPIILADVANEYQVSHVVIPDAYKDFKGTINLAQSSIPLITSRTKAKLFVVLQGRSIDEMFLCYDFFSQIPAVDIIGINFTSIGGRTRKDFFESLLQEREVVKKIHFLGVQSPYEMLSYNLEQKSRIFSIDTSNPIITGWQGYRYKDKDDLSYIKPTQKLADNLDISLTQDQIDNVFYNIDKFKQFANK